AGGSRVNRSAGGVRPQASGDASAGYRHQVDGRQRHTARRRDLADKGPSLKRGALPAAQQRASADSYAGGELRLQGQLVSLIETGKPTLVAQVQPVLSNHG